MVEAFYSPGNNDVREDSIIGPGVNDVRKFVIERNGMYVCGICFKQYRYKRGLKRHLLFICNRPPQFKCPVCFKKCSLKHNLKSHIIFCHGLHYWNQFSDSDFR